MKDLILVDRRAKILIDLHLSEEHMLSFLVWPFKKIVILTAKQVEGGKNEMTKNIYKKVRKEKIRPNHMNKTFSQRME